MSIIKLNITLDILKGCVYSCMDCNVDKNYDIPSVPDEDTEAILSLIKDAKYNNGVDLFEFTVGPTDFIKSEIGLSVLDHPLVTGLLKEYDTLVITLSMLSDVGLVELAKKLDEVAPNNKLRVGIPVTIKNAYNNKFVDMIKRRVGIIRDNMKKCKFDRIYTNVIMTGDSLERFNKETNEYISKLRLGGDEDGLWQTPEFIFGHSRYRFDDILSHQKLVRDYRSYCEKTIDSFGTIMYKGITPHMYDPVEIAYRDGKLYYVPILVERFHWFHDDLLINKPWDLDAVFGKKDSIMLANFMDTEHSKDCVGCIHSTLCNNGDIKTLMRMLNVKTCLPNIAHREELLCDYNSPTRIPLRELLNNG